MQLLGVGSVFAGQFEIVRPLASGGMGSVFVAKQISTGRLRALKVMNRGLSDNADLRARFTLEAQVGARVGSEHVVEVVAAGIDDATGMPWLAMELLEGRSLAEELDARGALPADALASMFGQIAHAIGAAHARGVVHRDLKPENIFLATRRDGGGAPMVKVLDFGIAKLVDQAREGATAAIGTPLWMAPEQTEPGQTIMPGADVWALGLIAFRALTGKVYWLAANGAGATAMALIREIGIDPMPSASDRARALGGLPPPAGFDAWFARSANRDPALRFRDAREQQQALESVLRGGGVTMFAVPTLEALSQPPVAAPPSPIAAPSGPPPVQRSAGPSACAGCGALVAEGQARFGLDGRMLCEACQRAEELDSLQRSGSKTRRRNQVLLGILALAGVAAVVWFFVRPLPAVKGQFLREKLEIRDPQVSVSVALDGTQYEISWVKTPGGTSATIDGAKEPAQSGSTRKIDLAAKLSDLPVQSHRLSPDADPAQWMTLHLSRRPDFRVLLPAIDGREVMKAWETTLKDGHPIRFAEGEQPPAKHSVLVLGAGTVVGDAKFLRDIDWFAVTDERPGREGSTCTYREQDRGPHGAERTMTLTIYDKQVTIYDRRTAKVVSFSVVGGDGTCPFSTSGSHGPSSYASDSDVAAWLATQLEAK